MSVGMTLLMSTIGSGLLSIPYAFMTTGAIAGTIVLIISAAGAGLTAEVMLDCQLTTGLVSYEEIALLTFGPKVSIQYIS